MKTVLVALLLAWSIPAVAQDLPPDPAAFVEPVVYGACPQAGWALEKVDGTMTNYSGMRGEEPWSILCNDGVVYAWSVQWLPLPPDEVAALVASMSRPDAFGAAPATVSTPKLTAYGWTSKNASGDLLTFVLLVPKKAGSGLRFTATSLSLQDALISAKGVK